MPLYPPASSTGYTPGGTDVAVADGGTGSSTAAGAATNLGLGTGDSPQFTAVNIGAATDTTVTRTGAGDIAVEGNGLYRAGGTDVAVADGGTGSSTAANARTALGLAIGTDVDAFASTIGQAEAEAGVATTVRNFTALRVAQAIAALAGGGSALTVKDEGSSLATAATSLDFVGAGVVASGTGAAKTITISTGAASLSYQQAFLSADVTMTSANTFYDGPTVTLSAGTWFIIARVSMLDPTGGQGIMGVKLWDGTTVAANGTIPNQAFASWLGSWVLMDVVVIASGTPTWKISVVSAGTANVIKASLAAATGNLSGNFGSSITAIQIA